MGMATVFGFGVLIGILVTNIIFRTFLVGALRIVTSDPEDGSYMFLELSKGMDNITSKTYIILKVNLENFAPHK